MSAADKSSDKMSPAKQTRDSPEETRNRYLNWEEPHSTNHPAPRNPRFTRTLDGWFHGCWGPAHKESVTQARAKCDLCHAPRC